MKLSKTIAVLCVALAAAATLTTDAAAKSFAEGLACTTQNSGTPLNGAVFVTFTQTVPSAQPLCNQPTDVEAMIRLEHSQVLRTYFTVVHVADDVCNPCTVMDALLHDQGLIDQIRSDFCGGASCTIGVKELSSVGNDVQTSETNDVTTVTYRTLADVVVTAH